MNRSAGQAWPKDKAERVDFLSRAVLFERLITCAERMRNESGMRLPEEQESIWSALTGEQEPYAEVWKHVESDEMREEVLAA